MDEQKVKNLFNALTNGQKSIFYASNIIMKGLVKKARTSLYPKDKVFVKIFNELDNDSKKKTSVINENLPLNTPFVEKREDVDRLTLYSFSGPFEALQADIADIRFLGKSAADPKYFLLFVDLFTSMIYTYPVKRCSLLTKKMQEFYNDVSKKRAGKKMRLQTDREFQQTKIKQLIKEYNVDMYNTNLRGGKAFAAEQKIRELKKLLLRGKRIQKSSKKGVKPNDLIKKATFNLNNIRSTKYGFLPEQIEKKV